MVAGLADVEYGVKVGRLSRRGEHSADTPFKFGDFCGDDIVGGILQTGVEVSRFFEVEETGHLFAGFVAECRALVNGYNTGFSLFGCPAALYADGFGAEMSFVVHMVMRLLFTEKMLFSMCRRNRVFPT